MSQSPPHLGRQWGVLAALAAAVLVFAIWRFRNTATEVSIETTPPAAATVAPAPAPTPTPTAAKKRPQVLDDPAADGWETELFNDRAGAQFKHVAKWIAYPEKITTASVDEIAAASFQCGPLRPADAQVVYDQPPLRVTRVERIKPGEAIHQGAAGLIAAIRDLAAPFKGATDLHTKFKIYNVEPDGDTVVTRQYVAIAGITDDGPLEENATWLAHWTNDDPPRLKRLIVEDYERAQMSGPPLFADCTEAVLQRNLAEDDLLGHSLPHWYVRIQSMYGQGTLGYHGLAIGDANGDGLDDVYLCHPGGMPNQLFLRNPDGTVTEAGAEAGVDWMETTMSALFVDLDNDGDQDLITGTTPKVLLMENDGTGRFTGRKVLQGPPGSPMSIAATDYDGDGNLDFYITYYSAGTPMPYHDASNGPPNVLWRNAGDWRFANTTVTAGFGRKNYRFSFAACWEDYDNDGDQDLYVANDFGPNNLYQNQGDGRFLDVAEQAGTKDISSGMSAAMGDYDQDGVMDIYISNMFSSAGNRVTFQRKFRPDDHNDDRKLYQRLARGNTLFRGRGDGTFEDVSVDSAVTMGRWAWCSDFVDINNDTYQDLLIANGNMTNDDPKDL